MFANLFTISILISVAKVWYYSTRILVEISWAIIITYSWLCNRLVCTKFIENLVHRSASFVPSTQIAQSMNVITLVRTSPGIHEILNCLKITKISQLGISIVDFRKPSWSKVTMSILWEKNQSQKVASVNVQNCTNLKTK